MYVIRLWTGIMEGRGVGIACVHAKGDAPGRGSAPPVAILHRPSHHALEKERFKLRQLSLLGRTYRIEQVCGQDLLVHSCEDDADLLRVWARAESVGVTGQRR